MPRTRALLVLLLALILPIQGLAAAFAPLHRALNADNTHGAHAMAAMPCHEHKAPPGAQHAPTHDEAAGGHAPEGETPVADIMAHACCHQVFNTAPSMYLAPAARKFSDVPRFVLPLATLYIPDSPDRPPRG
ncbi:MAG: hypothetical protein FJY56_15155 [Betaproteobacteria bacterium]|nr:hypothetical protein [Betaproteobacteria bacterium]